MQLKEELAGIQTKQKEIISQIQKLDGTRQNLLQEALRLDGEARVIQRLLAMETPSIPTKEA